MLATIFDIDGHQKLGARFAIKHCRAAGGQQQLIVFAPACHAIGECREDGKRQCIGIVRLRLGRFYDPANLLEMALSDRVERRIDQRASNRKMAFARPN